MITRNDLLRIEARKSQVKYQLGQVENGADLCRMSLCHDTCQFIGRNDLTPGKYRLRKIDTGHIA